MEIDTKLKLLCYICKSSINVKTSNPFEEICHKFQIYTNKFLNFPSCSQEKFEVAGQSFSDSGDDENCKNKIYCCVQCNSEVETFCEMWESLESLNAEIISSVVNISNLPINKFQPNSEISQQSLRHCLICQAVPMSRLNLPGRISRLETCLKFTTFVTRFVLNTENPCFDKKIVEIFVEIGERGNSAMANLYCCDICLSKIEPFCEMYEALDTLRLEILRILDKISNRNKSSQFQSNIENHRTQSFPRVKIERLPGIHRNKPKNSESPPKADNQIQLDDDYFGSIELTSNGIPSPSPNLQDTNNEENADNSETAPPQTRHMTMNTRKSESGGIRTRKTRRYSHISGYKGACLFCQKELPGPSQMEKHLRRHTHEKCFVCRICLRECSYRYSLLNHRRTRHFQEELCNICGKSFGTNATLKIHVQRVHEKVKPHKCDICGKDFFQRFNLQAHRRKVHTDRPPHRSCDICGKTFAFDHWLTRHKQTIHNDNRIKIKKPKPPTEPYSCDICGKSFSWKCAMVRHKRSVHFGIKPKTLPRRPLKNVPGVCHVCGKTIASSNRLAEHLKVVHQLEFDESLLAGKKFKCTFTDCHWAFNESKYLQRHILTHTGEKNFQCDECGKSFTLQFQLKRHKECHKEVRPHVCKSCGKGFNLRYRLTNHVKKYHTTSLEIQ